MKIIIFKNFFSFSGIHLDEIVVYETIPSDSLEKELNEYLNDHGVKLKFDNFVSF